MARYYFDIHDGDQSSVDEEGRDFRDLDEVQVEAALSLADMARDAIRAGGKTSIYRIAIHVRDDAGAVMKARFAFDIERTN